MKILLLGDTGMLGHIVKNYMLEKGYEVYSTSRNKNDQYYFDALDNIQNIEKIIKQIEPDFLINCIGILNQFAEDNHSKAVILNSYLPHYLDELSEKYKYKFIHISTDCVFDGERGSYKEDDIKTARNFYGQSKALGEVNNTRSVTFRTSIIGPDINKDGIGLFKWFMNQNSDVKGYDKTIWSGVTTLQLAKVIEKSFKTNITGIYHAVNNETISKYELLNQIKEVFKKDINILKDSENINDKSLVNTRKNEFDFEIPSYYQMLTEMKEWIDSHPELYIK